MPINTPEDIKFEIIINIDGVDYYLDTNGSTAIPLNLSVGDIRDFATRKSSFSLSIKVPETSHNRFIFNSISDLSVDLQYFNPNWKSPVTILCDSIPVFTGNLQLKSIDSELDGGEVYYNCVVYSESDDFFKTVGEYTLGGVTSNLDFSEYDHKYTYANIVDSWSKDYQSGYFYPLIDTTGIINKSYIDGTITLPLMLTSGLTASLSSRMQISDFLPATYIKTIWDKIFETAGYKYESNFLNSEEFKNMIFPFSQKLLENNREFLKTLSFYVGKSTPQIFPLSSSNSITPNNLTNPGNLGWVPGATPPGRKSLNYNQEPGFYQFQALSFTNVTTPFDNSYGLWDTANSKYVSTSELVQQEFKLNLNISFVDWGATAKNALLAIDPRYQFGRDLVIVGVRSRDISGATVSGWSLTPTFQDLLSFPRIPFFGAKSYHSIQYDQPAAASSIPAGYYQLTNLGDDGTGNDDKIASLEIVTDRLDGRPTVAASNTDRYSECRYDSLFPGEEVRFFLVNYAYIRTSQSSSSFGGYDYFDPTSLSINNLRWKALVINTGSSISNLVSSAVIAGQTLTYNSVLPQNLKQKDFLTSIVKMFNLYIEPSKDKSKTLYIEPRDVYYGSGEIKDWSDKVNADKPAVIQVLAETQNKSTLFTYRGDSDYYNTDYSNIFKREYGDVKYVIDNDFLSGQKKVECIFSPTPMSLLNGTQNPRGMVYPSVFKLNNGKPQKANGYNFRILYKNPNGLIALDSRDAWIFETTSQTSYPYAGHFYPDPYEPEIDLNWGQSYLYYSNKPTSNNLFNRFWRKTINEISDINSRIVTLEMYLDSQDISDFKFSDNIYLVVDGVGGYYKVNKITNYDPTKIKPVMVEFIKTIDITVPIQSGLDTPDSESINLFSANETNSGRGRISNTEYGNQISGNGHIMSGVFNTVGNDGVIVSGDGNILTSRRSLVIGNSNNDSSVKNTIILGDKNMSSQGEYKLLIGEGNTDSSSSTSLIVGTGNFVEFTNNDVRVFGNNNELGGPAKNITTYGNNNRLSGETTFVVGDVNLTAQNTKNIFLFGNTQSVVSLGGTSSVILENIASFGNINYIEASGAFVVGTGVTVSSTAANATVFGSNIIATQSDTIYINQTIVLGPSASTTIPITITELQSLITSSSLSPGGLYNIIDGGYSSIDYMNKGVFLRALDVSNISNVGNAIFLCPRQYTSSTDIYGNVWKGVWNLALTVSINDLVIWGGMVWKNLTGSIGTATTDFVLDGTNWILVPRSSFSNNEYIDFVLGVEIDIPTNTFTVGFDNRGNTIISNGGSSVLVSDWNDIKIYNNRCFGIYNNTFTADIYNNSNLGIISNNVLSGIGGISNNSNIGNISNNSNASGGGSLAISFNSNIGGISNNSNTSIIYGNSNTGPISTNSNNGAISNNSNIDSISSNSNIGNILSNSNQGSIDLNINTGNINFNSNGGPITNNSNGGDINFNINRSTINANSNGGQIIGNSNNGQISNNSNTNSINENLNNGGITTNSNGDSITKNLNNGGIISNSNTGKIENNTNNGFIFSNVPPTVDITDPIVNK